MSYDNATPSQALLTNRIIWGAILMGLLIISGVMIFTTLVMMGEPIFGEEDRDLVMMTIVVLGAVGLAGTATGWIVREVIWRRGRNADGSLDLGAFGSGNIVFFAAAEMGGVMAMLGFMLTGSWALMALTGVVIVVIVLNFPREAQLGATTA